MLCQSLYLALVPTQKRRINPNTIFIDDEETDIFYVDDAETDPLISKDPDI